MRCFRRTGSQQGEGSVTIMIHILSDRTSRKPGYEAEIYRDQTYKIAPHHGAIQTRRVSQNSTRPVGSSKSFELSSELDVESMSSDTGVPRQFGITSEWSVTSSSSSDVARTIDVQSDYKVNSVSGHRKLPPPIGTGKQLMTAFRRRRTG